MRTIVLATAIFMGLTASAIADVSRWAVVDNASGGVVNIVEWDDASGWQPPPNETAIPIPAGSMADVGWTYSFTSQAYTAPTQ